MLIQVSTNHDLLRYVAFGLHMVRVSHRVHRGKSITILLNTIFSRKKPVTFIKASSDGVNSSFSKSLFSGVGSVYIKGFNFTEEKISNYY